MLALFTTPRARRLRLADRLLDEHGEHLSSLAGLLTSNRDRSDRLVVEALSRHVEGAAAGRRGSASLSQLAAAVHGRWTTTHAPRGPGRDEHGSSSSRLQHLSDVQLGLVGLCLFGGCTVAAAGHLVRLTPVEAAHVLREAMIVLAASPVPG